VNPRSREAGVTLMEIVIALFILSVVLASLGGLMSQVSFKTRQAAALTYLSAAAQEAAARVEALPWDSLSPGTATDTSGRLVYVRSITVTDVAGLKAVQVVLTPTGSLTAPPETLVVYRARPRGMTPFSP
jgi:Tfp pilus assembly protein PilV